jgi:Tfp pilus assembly protein PilX
MTLVLSVLQILTLLAVAALLLRRREAKDDPRATALLADLPAQFARLEARLAAVDEHLHTSLAQLRKDTSVEAQAGREAAERSATPCAQAWTASAKTTPAEPRHSAPPSKDRWAD